MPKQTKPLRVWAHMPIEEIPHTLNGVETCLLMGMSKSTFFALLHAGEFKVEELKPRQGAPKYSGKWVRAYLRNELDDAGLSTVPRFLNKARAR